MASKEPILPKLVVEHVVELVVHDAGIGERLCCTIDGKTSTVSKAFAFDGKRMPNIEPPEPPSPLTRSVHPMSSPCKLPRWNHPGREEGVDEPNNGTHELKEGSS